MAGKRAVFFISDGTGITAETLGHSLLTQFNDEFEHVTLPFTNTVDRADQAVARIEQANRSNGVRSIVFTTVIDPELRELIHQVDALLFDFFDTFIAPMERELGERSSHTVGRSHGIADNRLYDVRIDAMNYALSHDDGAVVRHYDRADVILVGVSRSGKTPTCIYLALQFGIYAANYPLTEEDLLGGRLPSIIRPHRRKLYALTIRPERLSQIRGERRPDSRYASLRQCQYEVARAEGMFQHERIPVADTTAMSIEEIATTIIHERQLRRRLY
ncbi:posphoenolpyruvate synthetase regulatory kinase/phosphorylase PpsR [Arhodomonas sp. SL1]|uniref:posphoenolpyruvate synthetase regulatory kinase/phosphorylase PpsR n=1 Tax=Arhodomonas sp. SL1 TaxID=3425691 RepID=UPI003F882959